MEWVKAAAAAVLASWDLQQKRACVETYSTEAGSASRILVRPQRLQRPVPLPADPCHPSQLTLHGCLLQATQLRSLL